MRRFQYKAIAVCIALALPGSAFAYRANSGPDAEIKSNEVSQACRNAVRIAGVGQTAGVYEAQIAGGIETTGAEPTEIIAGLQTCMGTPGMSVQAQAAIRALIAVTGAGLGLNGTGAVGGANSGRSAFTTTPGFSGGAGADYS